jgi:hypothetical protein
MRASEGFVNNSPVSFHFLFIFMTSCVCILFGGEGTRVVEKRM